MTSRPTSGGFTIIELMVAITLGMMIMAMTGLCFQQAANSSHRASGLMDAHHRARVMIELLKRDLQAMHPGGKIAMWTVAPPDPDDLDDPDDDTETEVFAGGAMPVQAIAFLTVVPSTDIDRDPDRPSAAGLFGVGEEYSCDLVWVKYKFEDEKLKRAVIEPKTASLAAIPSALAVPNDAAFGTFCEVMDNVKEGNFGLFKSTGAVIIDNQSGLELDGDSAGANITDRPGKLKVAMKVGAKTLHDGEVREYQFVHALRLPVR